MSSAKPRLVQGVVRSLGDFLFGCEIDRWIDAQHGVKSVLQFLAQDSAFKVGERLLRAGVVEPVTRRKLRGTQTLYMPMNSNQRNVAAWAPIRNATVSLPSAMKVKPRLMHSATRSPVGA